MPTGSSHIDPVERRRHAPTDRSVPAERLREATRRHPTAAIPAAQRSSGPSLLRRLKAALKVLYLVVKEKNKKGRDIVARINGWKTALNAFALTHGDRMNNGIN